MKAGGGQFKRLLAVDRWWYVNWWEAGEERIRKFLGRTDISILRDRSLAGRLAHFGLKPHEVERKPRMRTDEDGESQSEWDHVIVSSGALLPAIAPLTLRTLRERIENNGEVQLFDDDDSDGCNCFSGSEEEEPLTIRGALP